MLCQFLLSLCSYRHTTVSSRDLGLIEQHQNLVDLTLIVCSISHLVGSRVVATDNLVARGIAAHLIVRDAEAHHIDTHIRG